MFCVYHVRWSSRCAALSGNHPNSVTLASTLPVQANVFLVFAHLMRPTMCFTLVWKLVIFLKKSEVSGGTPDKSPAEVYFRDSLGSRFGPWEVHFKAWVFFVSLLQTTELLGAVM